MKLVMRPPEIDFDVGNAMVHINYLAGTIGAREEGSPAEELAVEYIRARMVEYGYSPSVQALTITTNGRTTHNVVAGLRGKSMPDLTVVIGAHIDSKGGPGANDNATGCGILLELARVLKNNSLQAPSIEFVFFGGEEICRGGSGNDHHWGSRHFVSSMTPADRNSVVAMISVDMVGAGPEFLCRNMGLAPQSLRDMVLEYAAPSGLKYLPDTSSSGMSDHEAFEEAGIPSVWFEYKDYPAYHTPGDTVATVDVSHLANLGAVLQGFFEGYLTPDRVESLPRGD